MTVIKRATLLLFFAAGVSSLYSGAKELGSTAPPAEQSASGSPQTAALSFEFFKTKVEPIFLKNRPEHARCYGCHILSNRIFHLELLSKGNSDWTDEQSRRNFQNVLELVVRGIPLPASSCSIRLRPKPEEMRFTRGAGSSLLRTTPTGSPWRNGCVAFGQKLFLSPRRSR